MTVKAQVSYGLAMYGCGAAFLVAAVVTGVARYLGHDAATQGGQMVMLGSVAVAGMVAASAWFERQPPLDECSYCHRLTDAADLEPVAGGRRICVRCLTPREVA